MLIINNIQKKFGSKQILHGISAEIHGGEIVGILGPNGAGKSTLMRIITGYFFPDSGSVTFWDEDIHRSEFIKKRIGYLPEVNPLYEDMWVDEFLQMTAELKGATHTDLTHILQMTGLTDKRSSIIQTLSKWYRQRVGLAASLMWDPDVLILDEPTEGLDPGQRDEIKSLIRELGKTKTILISSHVLSELSDLVSRVIIIADGMIKLDDTLNNIEHARWWSLRIEAHFSGKVRLGELREHFPEITEVRSHDHKLEIHVTRDIRHDLLKYLMNYVEVTEFFSEKISLSDVFFETVK
jgi:ABC-2 type transport system ATP-binding protein